MPDTQQMQVLLISLLSPNPRRESLPLPPAPHCLPVLGPLAVGTGLLRALPLAPVVTHLSSDPLKAACGSVTWKQTQDHLRGCRRLLDAQVPAAPSAVQCGREYPEGMLAEMTNQD